MRDEAARGVPFDKGSGTTVPPSAWVVVSWKSGRARLTSQASSTTMPESSKLKTSCSTLSAQRDHFVECVDESGVSGKICASTGWP
jgi:hypothetical protein